MSNYLTRFVRDDSGNAGIDWTILMAGLLVIASGTIGYLTTGMEDLSERTSDQVAQIEVNPS